MMREMDKVKIISFIEINSLLPTKDNIDICGHAEACPKSKCKASLTQFI